jgi:hypothetical protein
MRNETVVLRIDGDLAGWATRPSDDRLRPEKDPFLLLRQASVDLTGAGGRAVGSLGRFRAPGGGAGTSLIDGARLAWAGGGVRRTELGAFAGYRPDPFTLGTSSEREAYGLYADINGPVGVRGAARALFRLARLRANGFPHTEGGVSLTLDRGREFAFQAAGAIAHASGETRVSEARVEVRRTMATVEAWVRHRRSAPLPGRFELTPARASTAVPSLEAASTRSEIGVARDPGHGARFSAQISRTADLPDRDRWSFDSELSGRWRFGPVRSWRLGYRGSVGWQEGHEGEVGATMQAGAWKVDFYGGGGALNQDLAKRITFIGRGGVSLGRALGSTGELSFTGSGYAARYASGGAAALRLSWRF